MGTPHVALLVGFGLVSAACLDPLSSDTVRLPQLILPAGSTVPSVEDEPAELAQIEAHDGISGTVVRATHGFWNGRSVRYWDFGAASPLPIPIYMLAREDAAGFFDVDGAKWMPLVEHPPIIGKIPGDAGYSPWWTVVLLPVTDAYDGQLVTSVEAIDEARREGLIGAPMVVPMVVNCPVVPPYAELERTPGQPNEKPTPAYYDGMVVHYFSFDAVTADGPSVPVGTVYQLRREGAEPLSEPLRGVDMTGDGDLLDTNDVFSDGPGDAGYSGMARLTDLVVKADVSAIDTTHDEATSGVMSVDDLFMASGGELVPDPARVIAVYPGSSIMNWPIAALDPVPASD